MLTLRTLVLVAIFGGAALGPSSAWADDPRELARAHFSLGRHAYEQGHYREAASHFSRAFAVERLPALLYNEAQAWRREYETTGNLDAAKSARTLYQQYLALADTAPDDRRDANNYLPALEQA